MKHILVFLIATVPFLSFSQIRNTKWGDSKEQVKKIETAKMNIENENVLSYSTTVSGMSASLLYDFNFNKLATATYLINENYVNKNRYIVNYLDIKKQLTKKYGEPVKDDMVWSNSLYKGDHENYGLAVSAGHLSYKSFWKADNNTTIMMVLDGEKFECSLSILYVSDDYYKKQPEVDSGL